MEGRVTLLMASTPCSFFPVDSLSRERLSLSLERETREVEIERLDCRV